MIELGLDGKAARAVLLEFEAGIMLAPEGIICGHPIHITEKQRRLIAISPCIPLQMNRGSTDEWLLEDFDLLEEIYKGKASIVFKALHRYSGTVVVLKVYRKRKLSELSRYQVEREIRIHIALDHENIIKLYAAFEDEKNVYMVQEFAGCGDLFGELRSQRGGVVQEKYAVRDILAPFLNALYHLHSLNIAHRDIKPENILVTSSKTIKAADFGLAIDCATERPVTRAGTLDYMAPEALVCPDKKRPEENKDKTTLVYGLGVDCWAVGVLAYELIVGRPPFEQETRSETYDWIMHKEPKFPSLISSEAKNFILSALTKNAAQRPSVVDLLKHPWIQQFARSKHLQLLNKVTQQDLSSLPPQSISRALSESLKSSGTDCNKLASPPSIHRLGRGVSFAQLKDFTFSSTDHENQSKDHKEDMGTCLKPAGGSSAFGSRPSSRSLDLDTEVFGKSCTEQDVPACAALSSFDAKSDTGPSGATPKKKHPSPPPPLHLVSTPAAGVLSDNSCLLRSSPRNSSYSPFERLNHTELNRQGSSNSLRSVTSFIHPGVNRSSSRDLSAFANRLGNAADLLRTASSVSGIDSKLESIRSDISCSQLSMNCVEIKREHWAVNPLTESGELVDAGMPQASGLMSQRLTSLSPGSTSGAPLSPTRFPSIQTSGYASKEGHSAAFTLPLSQPSVVGVMVEKEVVSSPAQPKGRLLSGIMSKIGRSFSMSKPRQDKNKT